MRRGGELIDFKVFGHDQEDVEIFWCRFRGDEASPDEDSAKFPACGSEIQ